MKVIYNDGTVAECPAEDELHVIRHTRGAHPGPGHQAPVSRGRTSPTAPPPRRASTTTLIWAT